MKKQTVSRLDKTVARRLREARRETGLSTRSVASKLPKRLAVSHTTIASYENGTTAPPVDVLAAFGDVYHRPLNWFLEKRECLSSFRYRNITPRTPLIAQRQFEALAGKWADAYVNLERYFQCSRRAKPLEASSVTPKELADVVRKKYLNLDDGQPIQSVVGVLETFSAWAMELRASFHVDNAVARHGENFFIVINPQVANERLRMNAAHELAHYLWDGCRVELGWNEKEVEKRAYQFASFFLLPETQLRAAFDGKSFLRLISYKERFGVPLTAMIYMAENHDIINTSTARWLWSEMFHRGWKRHEPGYVWRDRAVTFETMLESAIQTKKLSWIEAERITGIREDELRQRITDVTQNWQPEEKGVGESPDTITLSAFRVAES